MRAKNDLSYFEYKESVNDDFGLWQRQPDVWTPEYVLSFIMESMYENSDEDPFLGTSEFLFFMSVGEYELRHGILDRRIANGLGYHIYRYENMGRYKSDLTEEEIKEIEKDITYIKSEIILPVLYSYEDREWEKTE